MVATSLVRVSNWTARSLSDICKSPFSNISWHIFNLFSVPNTLRRSSFLATCPLDTFVKTVSVWRTSSISFSLKHRSVQIKRLKKWEVNIYGIVIRERNKNLLFVTPRQYFIFITCYFKTNATFFQLDYRNISKANLIRWCKDFWHITLRSIILIYIQNKFIIETEKIK